MKKIRAINKYDPKEIINDILDGRNIYRVNFDRMQVIDMKNRSIDRFLVDEKNYSEQYAYFEVLPDEPTEIEEIENTITEMEDRSMLNPPSAKLRLAAGAYGIETQGMTTRQIITSILACEAIEKQGIKC